ncbi:MAG TPA: hypothetical protein PLN83_11375 [Syntrophorhabdus sp.]|nr:hypothetical protein [Syntrophorhabdus sp.]
MHGLDRDQQNEKIKSLYRIRQSAFFLKPPLGSDDVHEIEQARQGYRDLLDSFYAEVSDYMSLQQHKAAERDIEYFIRLIELALAYFTCRVETGGRFNKGGLRHLNAIRQDKLKCLSI